MHIIIIVIQISKILFMWYLFVTNFSDSSMPHCTKGWLLPLNYAQNTTFIACLFCWILYFCIRISVECDLNITFTQVLIFQLITQTCDMRIPCYKCAILDHVNFCRINLLTCHCSQSLCITIILNCILPGAVIILRSV